MTTSGPGGGCVDRARRRRISQYFVSRSVRIDRPHGRHERYATLTASYVGDAVVPAGVSGVTRRTPSRARNGFHPQNIHPRRGDCLAVRGPRAHPAAVQREQERGTSSSQHGNVPWPTRSRRCESRPRHLAMPRGRADQRVNQSVKRSRRPMSRSVAAPVRVMKRAG